MELRTTLNMASEVGCDCCQMPTAAVDNSGRPFGCTERKTIFTHREEQVLRRIREARQEANNLKERIGFLEAGGPSALEAREKAGTRLEELRHLRGELEKERLEAARERMVLLGHA